MIEQLQIGNYRNFVYLITFDGESLVVDPWPELTPWETRIKELGSKLTGVLLTHTHWDHIGGVPEILEKYKVPIYAHEADAKRLRAKELSAVRFIKEGDLIPVGSQKIEVLHTPGHSAGECSFLIKDEKPWKLLTGDTVFVGMVGRTDLETGSTKELFETLQRFKALPADTVIYPGHHYGTTPTSTIARESDENEAFRCRSVEELDAIP